jgi:hypothetical protein
MESFDRKFEEFIFFCIIGCIDMQHSSYLIIISMEVVDWGLKRHDSRLAFQLSIHQLSLDGFSVDWNFLRELLFLLIDSSRGGILEVIDMQTQLMFYC